MLIEHPEKLPGRDTSVCYITEAARIGYFGMLHYRRCQNRVLQYATLQKLPEQVTSGSYSAEAVITGFFGMLHSRKCRLIIKDEMGVTCSKHGRDEKCI
jgi:hypothetical protein